MSKNTTYFALSQSDEDVVKALTNEQAGKLLKEIYYSLNNDDSQLNDPVIQLVFKQLQTNSNKVTKKLEETGVAIKQSFIERREKAKSKFYDSLRPYVDQYDSELLRNFYEYWTEHGENDRQMRFEKQTSFNIGRRLGTFLKNEKRFNKQNGSDNEMVNISDLRNSMRQ